MLLSILFPVFLQFSVQTGLDRMEQDHFSSLKGRHIAVLGNHTSVDHQGDHLVFLLIKAGMDVKAILSPEHGFLGVLDQENIGNSVYPETNIPIYSLYGKTRRPTPAMLKDVDLLVFDIQDVGVRYYTYQTTLLYAMEECSKSGIEIMVLDRPNPVGGIRVAGPILQPNHFSFTGSFSLPVVFGMTMGELAKLFQGEQFPELKLSIEPCKGWKRTMSFEDTGLCWVNPSPNIRNVNQAYLYQAIGLLETTNLSVGRGTDTPFECFGAPWLNPTEFLKIIKTKPTPGVDWVPFHFVPQSGPYKGEKCGGVQILLRSPESLEPIELSYRIFRTLVKLYPNDYKPDRYIKLLGNDESFNDVMDPTIAIKTLLQKEKSKLEPFLATRSKYLIYP